MGLLTKRGSRDGAASFGFVGRTPETVDCLHCKKSFSTDVVAPNTRHEGYKCPHCKLYMPVGRTDAPVVTAA